MRGLIGGKLVLSKIVNLEPYDAKSYPEFAHVEALGLVQNVTAKISQVFYSDDKSDLVNVTFPLTSHGVKPFNNKDDLTVLGADKGVYFKDRMPLDTNVICLLVKAKDYGNPPAISEHPIQTQFPIEQFMKCPKHSIFYVLFRPLIRENEEHPGLYKAHHDWALALQRYEGLKDQDRAKELVTFVEGANPLLAVHGVHLLARFYPQEIETRFVPWLLSGNLTPEACLAIDQELCLKNGQKWVESDSRLKFTETFEKLNPVSIEGTILTEFHKRAATRWLQPKK